jgi:exodeoxyribonuclease VII large subunit
MSLPLLPDERDDAPRARPRPAVVSVSALVSSARLVLERQLGLVWVSGEISNLYRAGSGHLYFTLKDASAQVKCTLYKSKAQLMPFPLANGMAIEVRAVASLYEPRGEFQLNVEAVRQAGQGALYERFLRLKARLEAAGWIAPGRKRPLPPFPRAVGVVTSPRGAALRDVLTTFRRRWPALRVIVFPAQVQGDGAGADVARAIALANRRAEVDVLLVCRGGGSIEDLWAFNEEPVARAVYESALPVVSGVGHETDFTICDFVADVRAPTPTAAAELIAPDCAEYRRRAQQFRARLLRAGEYALAVRQQRFDGAARRLVHPAARVATQHARIGDLARRLAQASGRQADRRENAVASLRLRLLRDLRAPLAQAARVGRAQHALVRCAEERAARAQARIEALAQSLTHLNPREVLQRGYAIVLAGNGNVVGDAATLRPGEAVRLMLGRGEADATVTRTHTDEQR